MKKDPAILLAATAEANSLRLSEIFLAKLEIKLEDSLVRKSDAIICDSSQTP
jgi:hypothetical protein